ncbi:MAG: alpha/beta hydrolase [Clostridiales bacterium]|nr:alpha/beta hydrolase [Clostridiales bacterium]
MSADFTLPYNPKLTGMATLRDDLTFVCEGITQRLTLISPARAEGDTSRPRFPVVVFLQGSGWTSPDRHAQLPQLCALAQGGMAVASITHRDSTMGHPFPSYLKDAKAAIRFLRSQAEELWLDPQRVAFFGTSSGGNTALLVGLTGDDPRYKTDDYAGQSDRVACVVDCFGPTDMIDFEGRPLSQALMAGLGVDMRALRAQAEEGEGLAQVLLGLIGQQDLMAVVRGMSPILEVKDGARQPPVLLLHGDADDVVPLSQSQKMHARLKAAGVDSSLVVVTGAGHEGSFWSQKLHGLIDSFLRRHLFA